MNNNPYSELRVDPPKHPGFMLSKTDFSFTVPITPEQHPLANPALAGQDLHVPKGMSFVEYLTDLEEEKRNEYKETDGQIAVLKWAEELTGIPADTIYNLANAFANAGEVFLEHGNNGGQKTNNGTSKRRGGGRGGTRAE